MIDFDLDAMIERERRRAEALAAGSTHIPIAQRTFAGPRPDAVSSLEAPELLYPLQWNERPGRCWNCGAGRPSFETHPPYGFIKRGETNCLMCSRTVVRWKSDNTGARLTPEMNPPRGRPPKERPQ